MYVDPNFRTLKEFKEAITRGDVVTVFSPGPFPVKEDGEEYIEGPHYPQPHKWYAKVTVRQGRVMKIWK